MYSRYGDRPDQKLHVPENYSGYAFASPPRREVPPRQLDVAKPTPLQKEAFEESQPPSKSASNPPKNACEEQGRKEDPASANCENVQEKRSLPPCVPTPAAPVKKRMLLGRGIDFDELLLIGLILLLRESEQSSEMVLWLALLLFMG